jgi:hypothetical protein
VAIGRPFGIPTWVAEALNRTPLPDAPVCTPWVLLVPHLPGPLQPGSGPAREVRLTPQHDDRGPVLLSGAGAEIVQMLASPEGDARSIDPLPWVLE